MKYIVTVVDGVYLDHCVVEAPKGTDEFTLLEIAHEKFKVGGWVSD